MPAPEFIGMLRLITTGYTHFRLDGGISITTPEARPRRRLSRPVNIIDAHFFSRKQNGRSMQRAVNSICAAACWTPMARGRERRIETHPGKTCTPASAPHSGSR